MGRLIKVIASIIGVLIILIVLAGLILPMIIDVNDHKDRISLEIKNATGYDVVIQGDIDLSLIPWIGLSLGKTHVASPPGFDERPMASLEELQIRVKFWPLFAGRIEAGQIILNQFELFLVKDHEGRANWLIHEEPEAHPADETAAPDASPAEPEPARTHIFPDLNIEGLQVINASISYEDRQTNQHINIRNYNLKTQSITLDHPFEFSGSMELETHSPDLLGSFDFRALTTIDSKNETFRVENFTFGINAHGEILARPIKDGSIRADFVYDIPGNAMHLSNLDINIHDARIQGQFQALHLDQIPDISFEINGSDLDLNAFMPAPAENHQSQETSAIPSAQPAAMNGQDHGPVDLSFLSDFNLEGQISLLNTKVDTIMLDSFSASIKSGQGKMTVYPMIVELYSGVQTSDIILEDIQGALHVNSVQKLENLQVGPFVQDLAQQDIITGTARVNSNIRTWGHNNDDFVKNMNGKAEISLSDGIIKGVDIERMIREVFALAAGQISTVSEEGGETGFTRMGASFVITNGVAVSRDLIMNSPVLGLQGDMTVDLPGLHLQSRSQISIDGALKEELAARYNLRQVTIPLMVQGPFDNLSFSLDSETIVKSFVQDAGETVLRKLLDKVSPADKDSEQTQKPPSDVEGLLRRMLPGQ